MDRETKMMDFSSETAERPRTIPLAKRPLAPWLRLAHITPIRQEDATHQAFLRTIGDFELVFQLEGTMWIWSAPDGGSVDLRAGEVAFIPPRFLHAWGNEPGRHIAVHFDLHANPRQTPESHLRYTDRAVTRKPLGYMPRFVLGEPLDDPDAPPLVLPLVTKLRAPRLWHDHLDPLVELWSRRSVRSLSASLRASEVLGWALRTIAEDHADAERDEQSPIDAKILELVRALDHPGSEGLGERPAVDELARRVGMGLTAFRGAFLRTMGRGPRRYLEERRMERAARALAETDHKIIKIAEAEGYDDPYHFSRVFQRVMGVSPRGYRAKARGG
jgi:AraC-like DNA-binding protein